MSDTRARARALAALPGLGLDGLPAELTRAVVAHDAIMAMHPPAPPPGPRTAITAAARQALANAYRTGSTTVTIDPAPVAAARAAEAGHADRAAIIAALRELGARTGRRPSGSDLQPKQTGLPTYSNTVAVFGSFAAALDAAGFPPRGRKWTRPEVLAALQDWTAAHGRPPTSADWRRAGPDHPGSRVVHELFHGWSAALARAGLRRVWRREQILGALVQWASEHGRPPTGRDWQSPDPSGRRPSTQQVRHAFGCWSASLEAADLCAADRGSRSGISRQAAGSASGNGRARASVRAGRSRRSRAESGAGRAS